MSDCNFIEFACFAVNADRSLHSDASVRVSCSLRAEKSKRSYTLQEYGMWHTTYIEGYTNHKKHSVVA